MHCFGLYCYLLIAHLLNVESHITYSTLSQTSYSNESHIFRIITLIKFEIVYHKIILTGTNACKFD